MRLEIHQPLSIDEVRRASKTTKPKIAFGELRCDG
jgi:hypothetical protein